MQSHQFTPVRTFLLVFARGEEVIAGIRTFAEKNDIRGGSFVAIGAFERAVIAWWSWTTKEYERREVDEQLEVLALSGNVAVENGRTRVHAHAALGRRDGIAAGGHLLEGVVRPTLELHLIDYGRPIIRKKDEKTNLSLITADEGDGPC